MQKYSSYILYLLISVLVAILYVNDFGPLESLQRSVDDFLCRATASDEARPNVALVTVDSRTQDEYGAWPWNHDLIADLVAAVASGEPKAIVLDFELSEDARQDSAGHTAVLAGQLGWIDNLVMPYDIALATFRGNRTNNPEHLFDFSITINNPLGIMAEESSLQVRKIFLPAEKLLHSDPYLGYDYTTPDDDRVLRHQSLVMNYEGYYYPSLSLLGTAVYLGVPPDQIKVIEKKEIRLGAKRVIPINDKTEFFVNFSKANAIRRFSAAHVLGENFNFKQLKDRLVVIDVDNFSGNQCFETPIHDQAPKSLIRATVADNIINNNFLSATKDRTAVYLLILFALGALCAFIMPQVSLLYRGIILVAGFFILANIDYVLFSSFKIITETVYIALELALFIAASPLLDSELLTGAVKPKTAKKKPIDATAKTQTITAGKEKPTPIREIKVSSSDPENVATTAIESVDDKAFPDDYRAIKLDEEDGTTTSTPEVPKTAPGEATTSALQPDRTPPAKPEIISPDDSEIEPSRDSAAIPQAGESSSSLDIAHPAGQITNLGRYRITGTLGKGAMGHVYKGVDPAINRPVALKTIRLDFVNDPEEMEELKERLFREAQAAGKLSHPNIVTIYDVGSEGHLQYIAMEYLEGRTLEEMIKKKVKFNYRIIARIIMQICGALEYAHERGIVHRDIKPANIMVMTDYRVKVMDYGIARVDSSSMTKTGIAMGTPNYISPEQLKGQKVDSRSDLFSLGVVMYELLLGQRPFKGENLTSLIYAIINHEPEKPSNVNPQIPLLFDHIIGRALKKDPNERYHKASDLTADLTDFAESFVS